VKNLCKWGVIEINFTTASGLNEMHAAFRLKQDAEAWLKHAIPNPRERKHRWRVVSLLVDL
jgi:hypothetical protein